MYPCITGFSHYFRKFKRINLSEKVWIDVVRCARCDRYTAYRWEITVEGDNVITKRSVSDVPVTFPFSETENVQNDAKNQS